MTKFQVFVVTMLICNSVITGAMLEKNYNIQKVQYESISAYGKQIEFNFKLQDRQINLLKEKVVQNCKDIDESKWRLELLKSIELNRTPVQLMDEYFKSIYDFDKLKMDFELLKLELEKKKYGYDYKGGK